MALFHHQKLPPYSTLLSGHTPPDKTGFRSEVLQMYYSKITEAWRDPMPPHAHQESDESFIVLQGALIVEVEGERFTIGPHEFCCFPRGVYHSIVEVSPPVEFLILRAPSKDDKVYQAS
jgi:mannose-6-phosphate isomerase-like protein (cupin superfamily)